MTLCLAVSKTRSFTRSKTCTSQTFRQNTRSARCNFVKALQNSEIRKHDKRTVLTGGIVCPLFVSLIQQTAYAQEEDQIEQKTVEVLKPLPKQVFFNIKASSEVGGQIVIQLFEDVPIGSQRFMDLSKGIDGVGYKLSKFNALFDNYINNEGVRSLSYGTDVSPITGGDTVEVLQTELKNQSRKHDEAGLVSLTVKTTVPKKVDSKLVAVKGQLYMTEEITGLEPNGTAFAITTNQEPALDDTNLIVGKVVQGMDLVKQISNLPAVKENTASPFFKIAKQVGDKRADVAEKGFKKPFGRVVIQKSGEYVQE